MNDVIQMKIKKYYIFDDKLPYQEDVSRFAPAFVPEEFTQEEKKYLKPFFSNIDKPIFVIAHLPEEVMGALSSRYSRSTDSMRRMFLKEYVFPIAHPEDQKNWVELNKEEKQQALETKAKFVEVIEALNSGGGMEDIVNIQRARKFFDTWLAQYGDDSIAEEGSAHLCLEGVSNLVLEEIVNKRIGISPLVKSTRYVSFSTKRADGKYQYIVPGEIIGTELEQEYKDVMDLLFDTYSELEEPYLDYIKQLYPKGEDETDVSFRNSRGAKRFDDIRDLLPFSTQINIALAGNGRAFEDLINRLMFHPIGEFRWVAQQLCSELETVVPSFVTRPKTERGAQLQAYRRNMNSLRDEMSEELLSDIRLSEQSRWVRLVNFTEDADVNVLASFLFAGSENLSLVDIRRKVASLTPEQRYEQLGRVLRERAFGKDSASREADRFKKVPRAFENASYMFEVWGRGGDFRDLHRHRQNTEEHQRFTTENGYDLEQELLDSPFVDKVKTALEKASELFKKLHKLSPDIAQYVVPFGYLQHWYMSLTAREIHWMIELRTGPQGRRHYREICQQMAEAAMQATPAVFQNLMVDMNDYGLSRRESEKRIDRKLGELGVKRE